MIAIGLVLGFAGAVLLRDALAEQVFGVAALEPWVLGAVAAVIVAISGAACMLPAIRATRVDPLTVLGEE